MMYKLLIVDDETQFRTTLCNCFPWNQVGFELAGQVSDGKMALDFLEKNTVHVLLCDIYMPIMNGIELLKILSTWENPPTTIFFSAYRNFEYAQQALSLGARFYILKPIKYEDLVQTFSTIKLELDKKYHISEATSDVPTPDTFVENVHNYYKTLLEAEKDPERLAELNKKYKND